MKKLVTRKNMKYRKKKVIEYEPYCTDCGESLQGNGSIAFPYYCQCGIWSYSYIRDEFDVIPKQSQKAK